MANLLQKLRMLDAEPKKEPPSVYAQKQAEHCYHKQAFFPLSLFTDRVHANKPVLESIFNVSFPENIRPEDFLFLDTETTGLSGGAGTVAFQIGIGYFTKDVFVVEQFLMHEYPQEAEMLKTLNGIMGRFPVLCTFNGRTFDIPLLRSRFLMNRISSPSFPAIHADVLFPARRLWKLRLKSCKLSHLEEQLLHIEREDDLPGAEVPKTYFQYLKDGRFEPLIRVLEHNKQDIVSLAQLFFFMCKQVDQPEEIQNAEDLFSLAKAMEKQGESAKAMRCYRLSANTSFKSEALQAMAHMEKRAGNTLASVKLYQAMLSAGKDPTAACEALAKIYEHQLKDLPSAISYTRQALLILSEPSLLMDNTVQERQKALQYRYARLRRKLAGQS